MQTLLIIIIIIEGEDNKTKDLSIILINTKSYMIMMKPESQTTY